MNVRQFVQKLIEDGHSVKFRIRTDGGILITEIDGTKFTGAKGNKIAREMYGVQLSENRAKQLESALRQRQLQNKEIEKKLRQVQRKWNKAFPKGSEARKQVGSKTFKKIRWRLENLGYEEAMRSLLEAEKYAEGLAYSKNVQALIDSILRLEEMIETTGKDSTSKDIQIIEDIIAMIEKNAYKIREEWIYPIYELLYDFEKLYAQGMKSANDLKNEISRIISQ